MTSKKNAPAKKLVPSKRAQSSLGVTRRVNTKAASSDPKALILRLDVQQSLLSQLKTCNEILQFNAEDRTIRDWKGRLEFMLLSQSQVAFDEVIKDLLLEPALRTPIEFTLPTDKDEQALVGMAFAEASGTDASEIAAIVGCLVNVAYYATYKEPPRKCYNDSFGDGTILSAIKRSSMAYDSAQWKRVMSGDVLLSKAQLEQSLIPAEVLKLKACCEGVTTVSAGAVPYPDTASGRTLVQFNQAANSPPSLRQEKVAKYGVHTFYAFKIGRECQ